MTIAEARRKSQSKEDPDGGQRSDPTPLRQPCARGLVSEASPIDLKAPGTKSSLFWIIITIFQDETACIVAMARKRKKWL